MMLLLIAFCSFGQTGMTAKDSTLVPNRWLRKATVELNQYDDCRHEVNLLNKTYSDCKISFEGLKSENKLLLKRVEELNLRIYEKSLISAHTDSLNQQSIETLTKQLKRANFRRKTGFVMGTMAGVFVGVVIHSVIKH